ncbi:MAG: DUF1015 domain-containing protein [Candidatus Omnitrophota bacterium]
MAEVKPFKGILYNDEKINGEYSAVTAPPYDVISESMREELYEKSPYNIIRLILGKAYSGDNDGNNKYIRARVSFNEWQNEGVLSRDKNESFYAYLQEYPFEGRICRRVGFIGLMKIGERENDAVLPHEYTLSKPKEDRMNLLKQVKANLSPIFALYDDKDKSIGRVLKQVVSCSRPMIDIEIQGESHKLWPFSDKDVVDKLIERMKNKKAFIADGHHRYEVAKMYRDKKRRAVGYDGSADYVMMYFTDLTDSANLTIMATHRVVKIMPFSKNSQPVEKMGSRFNVIECGGLSGLMERIDSSNVKKHVFGYFDGQRHLFMEAKDEAGLLSLMKEEKTLSWKQLDVSVLHSAVFSAILGFDDVEGNITYVREPEKAESLVKDKSHMAAFFLRATRLEQLKAVALSGEMMPQKSTYFYPKLLTGLVINKF